jgi:hypothetical protein
MMLEDLVDRALDTEEKKIFYLAFLRATELFQTCG